MSDAKKLICFKCETSSIMWDFNTFKFHCTECEDDIDIETLKKQMTLWTNTINLFEQNMATYKSE